MSKQQFQIGDQVRVYMGPKVEGKVQRIGMASATVEVETDDGLMVISAPLGAMEKLNGEGPLG